MHVGLGVGVYNPILTGKTASVLYFLSTPHGGDVAPQLPAYSWPTWLRASPALFHLHGRVPLLSEKGLSHLYDEDGC